MKLVYSFFPGHLNLKLLDASETTLVINNTLSEEPDDLRVPRCLMHPHGLSDEAASVCGCWFVDADRDGLCQVLRSYVT